MRNIDLKMMDWIELEQWLVDWLFVMILLFVVVLLYCWWLVGWLVGWFVEIFIDMTPSNYLKLLSYQRAIVKYLNFVYGWGKFVVKYVMSALTENRRII